jgi:hypothetical protein
VSLWRDEDQQLGSTAAGRLDELSYLLVVGKDHRERRAVIGQTENAQLVVLVRGLEDEPSRLSAGLVAVLNNQRPEAGEGTD